MSAFSEEEKCDLLADWKSSAAQRSRCDAEGRNNSGPTEFAGIFGALFEFICLCYLTFGALVVDACCSKIVLAEEKATVVESLKQDVARDVHSAP